MKLHYKHFGANPAAAAWRQLLVVAYFPWLAKHRVFNEERLEEARAALAQRRAEEAEERGAFQAALAAGQPLTKEIKGFTKAGTDEIGAFTRGLGTGVAGFAAGNMAISRRNTSGDNDEGEVEYDGDSFYSPRDVDDIDDK